MSAATKQILVGALLLAVVCAARVSAFMPVVSRGRPRSSSLCVSRNQEQLQECDVVVVVEPSSSYFSSFSMDVCQQPQNRRAVFRNAFSVAVAGTTAASTLLLPSVANAASSLPTPSELERLRKGHARVQYLLKNWEDITEVCKNNSDQATKQVVRTDGGDKCDKTPLNVQIYMGYKSTEDPLYKADKLMVRAAPLVKNESDQADYLEAVENYREKADNTAMMAYTSSWGEANPNGGKDVIDDYLEKTRLDVVSSEKSLRLILNFLGLEPLPASKNP
jgi:hypothetical protein